MKIEKIDIKKELIEIPDGIPYMDFVERPDLSQMVLKDGQIPTQEISTTRKRYEVQKVHHNYEGTKNYLVSVDERGLFQDLIKTTDSCLERLVEKRTEFYQREIENWQYKFESQKEYIKSLPFYKRLFNKF